MPPALLKLALVIILCLPSTVASAAAPPPYKLAVVVEASAFMDQVWQGTTRGEALWKALSLQLNTLPVHVDYQVWWVGQATSTFDRLNWPRQERGGLPEFAGNNSPAPALTEALAWLQPGGSLLFIGNSPPGPDWTQALGNEDIFCHVLSLEPGADLSSLALAGGGGYFVATTPGRVAPCTAAAIRTAITQGRLLLITHNQNNEKLELTLTLSRSDIWEKSRKALSWRLLQILPGNYRISWPERSALPGPSALPERLAVGGPDGPELHVGGMGTLSVSSLDENGQEQNWPLAVLDAGSGKLWESKRPAPFTLSLPVGIYRVYSTAPLHQEWRMGLRAGQHESHAFGPRGSLTIALPAPGQDAQISYQLQGSRHQAPLRGQSGIKLLVNPGDYTLTLNTIPPITRDISIAPGQALELKMPTQGGLQAKRALAAPKGFDILDRQGFVLANGGENRLMLLQPGEYWLRWDNNPKLLPVLIMPGQINMVEEP